MRGKGRASAGDILAAYTEQNRRDDGTANANANANGVVSTGGGGGGGAGNANGKCVAGEDKTPANANRTDSMVGTQKSNDSSDFSSLNASEPILNLSGSDSLAFAAANGNAHLDEEIDCMLTQLEQQMALADTDIVSGLDLGQLTTDSLDIPSAMGAGTLRFTMGAGTLRFTSMKRPPDSHSQTLRLNGASNAEQQVASDSLVDYIKYIRYIRSTFFFSFHFSHPFFLFLFDI